MDLPFHSIPEAPDNFRSGSVVARMIDGLGYRYYWASESLNEANLAYKPSEDARSTRETLEHILGLSKGILNAAKNQANGQSPDYASMTYDEIRNMTLNNLNQARSLMINKKAKQVSKLKVIFQRGEKTTEFPYWNMINGQISDAIYHTGQIVSFRRSSGNPMHPGVSVFSGKTREK